uniref:Uncharacterized protein n=1 Tax=Arundo donax TaxID=35708 RepID=A0A0A9FX61_ARUDO
MLNFGVRNNSISWH